MATVPFPACEDFVDRTQSHHKKFDRLARVRPTSAQYFLDGILKSGFSNNLGYYATGDNLPILVFWGAGGALA
jgi:hypothetical protein